MLRTRVHYVPSLRLGCRGHKDEEEEGGEALQGEHLLCVRSRSPIEAARREWRFGLPSYSATHFRKILLPFFIEILKGRCECGRTGAYHRQLLSPSVEELSGLEL